MNRFMLACVVAIACVAPGCKSTGGKNDEHSGKGEASPYEKPGFTVMVAEDQRLWVFRDGSKDLDEYRKQGELVKFVTRPGAGPGGMTVRAPDSETIVEYAAAREGFVTFVRDGRIWVFRPHTKPLAEFEKTGEPAKCITRPLAGPMRMTVKGPDSETVTEYVCAKPGFVTFCRDGRLWVFRSGSKELAEFEKGGEPAKHVTRPRAGPGGITLKGPDTETIVDYAVACDGFATFVRDGRIWVFREGTEDLAEFQKSGEPAKCITRPLAGPMRMTIRGPDPQTVDAYLGAVGSAAPRSTATTVAAGGAGTGSDDPFAKPGFAAIPTDDGRLWVFREGSEELAEFRAKGEPAKHVTRPLAGPGGITLKGPDTQTIQEYVAAREGFATFVKDGRIWAFRAGSEDLAEFMKSGEPAKCITRPLAGPMRMTVKGPDVETVVEYVCAKPGFTTACRDGRLWVFHSGSKELAEFRAEGEPAKHVTRPRAGPGGITLKGPDTRTIQEYAAACEGFATFVRDDRIWVFRSDSEDLADFQKSGEPAKCITRPLAGPMRMTIRGSDEETVEAYITASGSRRPAPAPSAAATEVMEESARIEVTEDEFRKPGFVAVPTDDGRLWVFREGSEELAEFRAKGEPAKHVTRPLAGPGGVTLKGPDTQTIQEYVAACEGFATFVKDGRIWVFRPGTEELAEFEKAGEPAKCITRPLAGPMRMTVKGPDVETIDAYLATMMSP